MNAVKITLCGLNLNPLITLEGEWHMVQGVDFVVHPATNFFAELENEGWQATEPLTGHRATKNLPTKKAVLELLHQNVERFGAANVRRIIAKVLK